jgi:hypothetical protein
MSLIRLHHGTSSVFLSDILDKGLLPRSKTMNSVYEGERISCEDRVYLTDVYPLRFGVLAIKKYPGDLLIVECQVDEARLEPDTDFTDQGHHESKFTDWKTCLDDTGCVSVRGGVTPCEMILIDPECEGIIPILEQARQMRISFDGRHKDFWKQQAECLREAISHQKRRYLCQDGKWSVIENGEKTQLTETT